MNHDIMLTVDLQLIIVQPAVRLDLEAALECSVLRHGVEE